MQNPSNMSIRGLPAVTESGALGPDYMNLIIDDNRGAEKKLINE